MDKKNVNKSVQELHPVTLRDFKPGQKAYILKESHGRNVNDQIEKVEVA